MLLAPLVAEDQPEGVPESSLSSRTLTTPTTTDDSVSTSSSRRRLSAPTPDHSWDFRRCSDADLSPIYSYATSVTSHHSIYDSFSLPASFKIETEITTGNTPVLDGIFMAGNTGQCGNLYVRIGSASVGSNNILGFVNSPYSNLTNPKNKTLTSLL